MSGYLTRDRLAVLAGLAGPLVMAAVLVPFRASFPNIDAALAMLLVMVVAVAANGDRLAGVLAPAFADTEKLTVLSQSPPTVASRTLRRGGRRRRRCRPPRRSPRS